MTNRPDSHRREFGFSLESPVPADRLWLLPDDRERHELHNELHARPMMERLRLPALVVHIVVLNEGISRQQELEHLRLLAGQHADQLDGLKIEDIRLDQDFELGRVGAAPLVNCPLLGLHSP